MVIATPGKRTFLALVAGIVLVGAAEAQPPESDSSALALEPFSAEGVDEPLLAGTLVVPENREDLKGRTIALHVVVVPARTKTTDPPLFDIAGGPGLAASAGASWYADDSLGYRATRDIVLVDQRGSGLSNSLHCPRIESASRLDALWDPAEVRRCREELEKNADLAQYGTLNAVHDLEAVRRALGYEKIDLVGISYGTTVVQTYMREYPQNARSAVLIGTAPIDEKFPLHHARGAEDVLQKIFDQCEQDPDCATAFPELRSEWRSLLASLDAGSINATYEDTTGAHRVVLARGPFSEAMRSLLLTTQIQRRIPYIIHRAAGGDFQPFFDRVSPDPSDGSPFADGMYFSVTCPESAQRITHEQIDRETSGTFLGRYRVDRQIAACAQWPTSAVPDAFLEPVSGSIPTLLLAGGMDYVTPVQWARQVSSRLSDSRVVVIDFLGHYPDGVDHLECIDGLIQRFLRAGTTAGLDLSCTSTMAPPPFVLE